MGDEEKLATELVQELLRQGKTAATAESCTGGMLAQNLTSVSGSSNVFEYGIIAYANRIKIKELKVSPETLTRYGAVSRQTAQEMAEGIRKAASSSIGLSTTGIAGPTGGTPDKPVGTVYIAVSTEHGCCHEKLSLLSECGNNRKKIRRTATERVLALALKELRGEIQTKIPAAPAANLNE